MSNESAFAVPSMNLEQIVAVTKFMNDHGPVSLEEDNGWAAVGVATLKYISVDDSERQLHILLGHRGAGILHFRGGGLLYDM